MKLEGFTRPGNVGFNIGEIFFDATNWHRMAYSRKPWLTGIYTDLHPWSGRRRGDKGWYVEVAFLGFSVGVCR